MQVPGYEVSFDPTRLDRDAIHRFLSEESYWCPDISRTVVDTSIDHSLCLGAYHEGAQVGFARIVTDQATFALVADVFVLPPHRGKGLSKWLMQEVMRHPALQGLRRMMLLTSDAHALYRQFGFDEIANAWRFMEILRTKPPSQLKQKLADPGRDGFGRGAEVDGVEGAGPVRAG